MKQEIQMSLRISRRRSAALFELFLNNKQDIPSRPEFFEEREKIAEVSSLEVKGA